MSHPKNPSDTLQYCVTCGKRFPARDYTTDGGCPACGSLDCGTMENDLTDVQDVDAWSLHEAATVLEAARREAMREGTTEDRRRAHQLEYVIQQMSEALEGTSVAESMQEGWMPPIHSPEPEPTSEHEKATMNTLPTREALRVAIEEAEYRADNLHESHHPDDHEREAKVRAAIKTLRGMQERREAPALSNIENAYSLHTGGGVMVDVLVMKSGHTLTVSDDITVHHESEEDARDYLGGDREPSTEDILTHY